MKEEYVVVQNLRNQTTASLDVKIASNTRKTIENSMRHWHTTIELNGASIANVKINRGMFQGDSLSPMLFVMSQQSEERA